MKGKTVIKREDICSNSHKSGTYCQHFDKTVKSCVLLADISSESFENLLSSRCNIMKVIERAAYKIALSFVSHLRDVGTIAEELSQEALLALVNKFKNRDFQFHSDERSFTDLLKYASIVMKNYLISQGTPKKIQGRYCVNFINGCTLKTYRVNHGKEAGASKPFPHFSAVKCRDKNPNMLNPPCKYFCPPKLDLIPLYHEKDSDHSNAYASNSIDTIQSLKDEDHRVKVEWESLISSMWRKARTVPEMRHIIRLTKYRILLDTDDKVKNISHLADNLGIDPSTIHNDFEMLKIWRSDNE